ncbi:MAG: heme exporter protein CcmB [Proteobacteria bacterium]|nr:heme exporter protein CcmB [Pseudomonadota bacterium]
MTHPLTHELKQLLLFFISSTLGQKEQAISALMFGISLVILCALATENLSGPPLRDLYVGLSFIITLITLSWFFMRIFANFFIDRTLETLMILPRNHHLIFVSCTCPILIFAVTSSLLLTWLLSHFLGLTLDLELMLTLGLSLAVYVFGLTPLGILCGLLTTYDRDNSLLFPLIYFPLATPLTIVSLQSSKVIWHNFEVVMSNSIAPIILPACMAGFFFCLSLLLFNTMDNT